MFLLNKPDQQAVQQFIEAQRTESFSYPEVGASRGVHPAGYNVDHNRICLGAGRDTFAKAVSCLQEWKMFELGWVTLHGGKTPIESGLTVGVLVRHLGFWSLNASRVIYVTDEPERYGFAYGTLPAHVERGEERFTVEYDPTDESVWYDLYAFSKPGHFSARAGYPISRALQKRFAKDSMRVMRDAVIS